MKIRQTAWIVISLSLTATATQAASRGGATASTSAIPSAGATISLSQAPEKIQVPGNPFIESIASDPSSSKVLYGINTSSATSLNFQLIRSVDSGKTWSVVSGQNSIPYSYNNRIAVSAGATDIAVTSDDGVFVSTDRGASFSKLGSIRDTSDVKISGSTMLVGFGGLDGSNSGVRFFDKQGATWVERPEAAQPEKLNVFEKREADLGICGAGRQDVAAGDGTCDFSETTNVRSVEIDPKNPNIAYAGTGTGIRRWDSQNGWVDISKNVLADSNVPNIQVDGNTGLLLMSTCNGIYQAQVDQSNSAMDPSLISFNRIRSAIFLWEQDGPLRTSASGSLRTYEVRSNVNNPNEMVAAADTGVYLSIDGGKSWARVQTGAMDDSDIREAGGRVSEYRTVTWLEDGSAEVSGAGGTYFFTP